MSRILVTRTMHASSENREGLMPAERDFYLRHHGGELKPVPPVFDATEVEQRCFAYGQRYWLARRAAEGLQQRARLLEIGCGNGEPLRWLAQAFGFEDALGVDIALPEDAGLEAEGDVRFIQGDFNYPLPVPDGSVDLLLAMMVVEHVFDPFAAMEEIRRLLAPSGVAVINLPLVAELKNRLRLLAGRLPVTSRPYASWYKDRQWDGNHLHYFTVESIQRLCSETGLTWVSHAPVGRFMMLKNAWPTLLASELTFSVRRT